MYQAAQTKIDEEGMRSVHLRLCIASMTRILETHRAAFDIAIAAVLRANTPEELSR